jgi:drug/metabolite transporter (DMT)-like permease
MCLIWGIPYLFIRIAVSEVAPVVLVFTRALVAALILMPIVLARGGLRGLSGKWVPLLAFTAVEMAAPFFLLASAEQHISSSLAGLLVSSVPLVGVLINLGFGVRERIGPVGLGGLLVGLVGVLAIVGLDLRVSDVWALVAMALVAVGYALGPAILSRYLAGVPSATVIGVALMLCAILYAPLAALQWPHTVPHLSVIASLVVLAVVCTALAFLVYFALVAEIGPVRSTVVTYINPAVAALLGVAVLNEKFTFGMGIGFVLVLLGSALATRRRRSSEAPEIAQELMTGEAL